MLISKIKIRNFRLLRDTTLDLKKDISLLIGKNNTGKTSFLVLLEHFFNSKKFQYNDFPISIRNEINSINNDTRIDDLSIQLIIEIQYDGNDNLEVISDFMLDLGPDIKTVKILFECGIEKNLLLKKIEGIEEDEKVKFIVKNLNKFLKTKIYAFDDSEHLECEDYFTEYRHKLIPKDLKNVTNLINIQIIHARRNVASSEDSNSKTPLATLTTAHFNSKNDSELPDDNINAINTLVSNMDKKLEEQYDPIFEVFLKNAQDFLNISNLNVKSDIQSKALFENSSQVTYGHNNDILPEHLNGLGYMNILYLLLEIERKKDLFEKQDNSINLLFIEEPEAHTHPQMQYVFAKNIKAVLNKINNLQTLITSHSSHIVSHSNFEDIRYLKVEDNNVEIKNFHTELKKKYSKEPEHFKFLEQYLNIQSAELFFASKVIFIEGITERMLLPLFIQQFDSDNTKDDKEYIPLASQNISILEVGANAKAFAKFLEFLDIQTLIITDIDTTKPQTSEAGNAIYKACPVGNGDYTSNATLRYFLDSPKEFKDKDWGEWFKGLIDDSLTSKHNNIKIAYQSKENSHHARSFEEAFISLNIKKIKDNSDVILGLKLKSELDSNTDMYDLTNKIIDKKSDFAASLLFLALSKDTQWETPQYIKEGLKWITN
ncbi:MAG: ATP-dependent endonuclease [Gammaproteobacteria bacterium]|nr:MAG: ATP-dependent endonuclease [Gammaproteobacteria bacterium]